MSEANPETRDGGDRDITDIRRAAEEVSRRLNDTERTGIVATPTGEDVSIDIEQGGFLDPDETGMMADHGFILTNVYPANKGTKWATVIAHHRENLAEHVGWEVDDE